jgi:hypothetical protein
MKEKKNFISLCVGAPLFPTLRRGEENINLLPIWLEIGFGVEETIA